MSKSFLQLNRYKHKSVFGVRAQRQQVRTYLESKSFTITDQINNLRVIIDTDLNLDSYISKITKTSFQHLRNILRICSFIFQADSEILVHVFVTSRLDYCNVCFTARPAESLQHLQFIQNAAVCILTRTKELLHWLPDHYRTGL